MPHHVHTRKLLSKNPSIGTNGEEDRTLVRNVDLEDSQSGFRSHLCDSLCPYERVTLSSPSLSFFTSKKSAYCAYDNDRREYMLASDIIISLFIILDF